MDIKITLLDGTTIDCDGAVDAMGITYEKSGGIVLPGKEDEMTMVMVPWHSVRHFEYIITPDMVKAQTDQQQTPHAELQGNRAQRRAANRV